MQRLGHFAVYLLAVLAYLLALIPPQTCVPIPAPRSPVRSSPRAGSSGGLPFQPPHPPDRIGATVPHARLTTRQMTVCQLTTRQIGVGPAHPPHAHAHP